MLHMLDEHSWRELPVQSAGVDGIAPDGPILNIEQENEFDLQCCKPFSIQRVGWCLLRYVSAADGVMYLSCRFNRHDMLHTIFHGF
jgi:hypothetical protein